MAHLRDGRHAITDAGYDFVARAGSTSFILALFYVGLLDLGSTALRLRQRLEWMVRESA